MFTAAVPFSESYPAQNVPVTPEFDARAVDAESQAEIDRLSSMKRDLISEKNTLEHVVKQGL